MKEQKEKININKDSLYIIPDKTILCIVIEDEATNIQNMKPTGQYFLISEEYAKLIYPHLGKQKVLFVCESMCNFE